MTNADFANRSAAFIALALAPILLWLISDVIFMIVGALLIATLLENCARPFRRLYAPRPLALFLAGILIIFVLSGAGYLFGAGVASEMADVFERIEQARESIAEALHHSSVGEILISHIKIANVPLAELVGGLFRISAIFLLAVLVTLFAGIYLAAEPTLYRDGVSTLFPVQSREEVNETIDHLADGLRLWLLGQLAQMGIIGLLSGLAVWLIGLLAPFALGVIAGVTELVPYLGPIVAAILAVLVAVTLSPTAVIWTLAAYLLTHQTEGHLLTPLIQRQMVYIPPAVILFGVAAITSLFGFAGAVFAAPLTVLVFVLIKKLYVRDALGEATALPGEESP
jgi:predicted PurR-regulated permease PerM